MLASYKQLNNINPNMYIKLKSQGNSLISSFMAITMFEKIN